MTTSEIRDLPVVRRVYYHDPGAPAATVVVPSVFVAARRADGCLLLVRRCDSGEWELPGGRVDVGESASETAVRETAEEAGVSVRVSGVVGLYTDPRHVVRAVCGEVRQQFIVVVGAHAVSGAPYPDGQETCGAGWFPPDAVAELPMRPPVRAWVRDALAVAGPPHLD